MSKTNKFQPISMYCDDAQFKCIKPKLIEIGLKIKCIGQNWDEECYLTNSFGGEESIISNIPASSSKLYNRKVYGQWNEKLFLQCCGIEEITDDFDYNNWYVRVTEESRPFIKDWMNSINVTSIGYTFSINAGYGKRAGKFESASSEFTKTLSWKEITLEQFKKYILKQTTTDMSQQKLKINVTELLEIHSIACSAWKTKIANQFLIRTDNRQHITFTQQEIDEMFSVATEKQKLVLEKIFGPKQKPIEWNNLKTGSKVMIQYTGQHISGIEKIDINKPVHIVFYRTPHGINTGDNGFFKIGKHYSEYCTFEQNNKFTLFSSHKIIDYITEVIEY